MWQWVKIYQVPVHPVEFDESSGFFDTLLLALVRRFVINAKGFTVAVDTNDASRVTHVADVELEQSEHIVKNWNWKYYRFEINVKLVIDFRPQTYHFVIANLICKEDSFLSFYKRNPIVNKRFLSRLNLDII